MRCRYPIPSTRRWRLLWPKIDFHLLQDSLGRLAVRHRYWLDMNLPSVLI